MSAFIKTLLVSLTAAILSGVWLLRDTIALGSQAIGLLAPSLVLCLAIAVTTGVICLVKLVRYALSERQEQARPLGSGSAEPLFANSPEEVILQDENAVVDTLFDTTESFDLTGSLEGSQIIDFPAPEQAGDAEEAVAGAKDGASNELNSEDYWAMVVSKEDAYETQAGVAAHLADTEQPGNLAGPASAAQLSDELAPPIDESAIDDVNEARRLVVLLQGECRELIHLSNTQQFQLATERDRHDASRMHMNDVIQTMKDARAEQLRQEALYETEHEEKLQAEHCFSEVWCQLKTIRASLYQTG